MFKARTTLRIFAAMMASAVLVDFQEAEAEEAEEVADKVTAQPVQPDPKATPVTLADQQAQLVYKVQRDRLVRQAQTALLALRALLAQQDLMARAALLAPKELQAQLELLAKLAQQDQTGRLGAQAQLALQDQKVMTALTA